MLTGLQSNAIPHNAQTPDVLAYLKNELRHVDYLGGDPLLPFYAVENIIDHMCKGRKQKVCQLMMSVNNAS